MLHPRHPARLLALLLLLLLSTACTSAEPEHINVNPYEEVDWQEDVRHHGNFHTHTTESDGKLAPADVIDRYHAIGHDILALTDHNKHTWPWSAFGRDPAKLGMIAIPGNELSRHHHTLSLFSHLVSDTKDHETAIEQVDKAGGISVLAHPGRYWKLQDGQVPAEVRDRYVALFKKHDTLIGFEVVNQNDRCPHDRALWDAVLSELMPDRPVWGMANDDSHTKPQIGLNTTVMLLPEHTEAAVRDALEAGRFYFTTVTSHPTEQRDPKAVPVIHRIDYDTAAGSITIEADCAGKPLADEAFTWISAGGKVVHRGPKLDLAKTTGLQRYVRAEIRGAGGTAYTQPFGLTGGQARATDADKPEFRFAQICDTQFGMGGYEHDIKTFEQAVKQINALDVDFVLVCGDLVNKADEQSFSDFKKVAKQLTVPCYYVPGNHDVENQPTPESLAKYRKVMGKDYFAFKHQSYLFVGVNSSLWKAPVEGETQAQDAFLAKTLKSAKDKNMPVFIVAHYPLFLKQPDEPESYSNLPIAKREELLQLFSESGVVAVLTGHAHRIAINEHNGIQLVSGEATSKSHGSPLGFRLWHIKDAPPFQHESIPLTETDN